MGELYRLTFENDKHYIGVAFNGSSRRLKQHRARMMKGDTMLYRAWKKYGEPVLTVLAIVEDRLLFETEIRAIEIYGTMVPAGYNLTRGGDGIRGLVHTPETRAKMSRSRLGHSVSLETCAKLSASHRNLPPDIRAKISAAARKSNMSPESRRLKSLLTHHSMTTERRAVNSQSTRNMWTPEHRARIKAALTGHVVSDETRRKISASLRLRSLNNKPSPISI